MASRFNPENQFFNTSSSEEQDCHRDWHSPISMVETLMAGDLEAGGDLNK